MRRSSRAVRAASSSVMTPGYNEIHSQGVQLCCVVVELPSGGKDQNMQMTSLGHSAVRFARAGVTVVVDPGCFSDPDALNGADAVLITHEHID
ncbi:MAG TPA: MBL fold metallo-hydrolase, partial [Streptosporangiaceae bacterium]|nr:MBL fold metallo-hydrolase [Streptosporangiaceae bacterium]